MTEQAFRPHHMLWSYHYARSVNVRNALASFHHRPVVFCDSGAYSAMTIGAPLDIGEYTEWLGENRDLFEVYSNLDVIGDADATWANQVEMERRGLEPLPVFHFGGDTSWLQRYIDAGYTYIALGGTTRTPARLRMKWFVHCFQIARAAADAGKPIVFHGFGVTSADLLASFPWYSVDSTSWNTGFKFGQINMFDQATGKWVDVKMFDPASVHAAKRLLADVHMSCEPFLDRKAYHHSMAVAASARTWRLFENWCRRRWGPIQLPASRHLVGQDGMKLYLADNTATNFRPANAAIGQPGLNVYLADGAHQNHRTAGQALGQPGINLYLAATQPGVHRDAVAGIGQNQGEPA